MNIQPQQIIQAICDTLLWSLAFGVLLAAAAGLLVLATRRSPARLRYQLLIGLLGVFAINIAVIFCYPLLHAQPTVVRSSQPLTGLAIKATIAQPQAPTGILTLLHTYSRTIVLIWLLIVLAKVIQLLMGLQSLYLLRRRHITAISPEWETRVTHIAAQLGIKRMVQIAESGMAKMPMVIGHFRPLILIPAGMFTALPPGALEAILVHELAHIFRRDYLVNILISSLEIVFFFNPAVLWLAALIRAERENCCDDIAVAYTKSKTSYIQALVACQEYQPAVPSYAMAFGRKDHFLGRVQRMLTSHNSSLNMAERTVLGLALLMTILITAAFSNVKKITSFTVKVKYTANSIIAPARVLSATKHRAVSKPKATIQGIDTNKFSKTAPAKGADHADTLTKNASLQATLSPIKGALSPINNPGTASALQPQIEIDAKVSQNIHVSVKNDEQSKPSVAQVAMVARPAEPAKSVEDYARERQAYAANPYPANYKPYHDNTNREKLTTRLIADGIIANAKELRSFKLSDSEFIVNGKKMPEDVYQKFKNLYVPESGKKGSWSWMYNYEEH